MKYFLNLFLALSFVFQFNNAQAQGFSPIVKSNYSRVITKATTYTATISDEIILVDGSGGAWTLSLPTAVGIKGKKFKIIRTDNTIANAVSVDPSGAQTIGGISANFGIYTQDEMLEIVSDNSNWQISDRRTSTALASYTPTYGGLGTVSGSNVFWQRVSGNIMRIIGSVTTGTVAASAAQAQLPGSLITPSSIEDTSLVGYSVQNKNNGAYGTVLTKPSSNLIYFSIGSASFNGYAVMNGSTFISSTTKFSWYADVPIAEWRP